MNDSEGAPAKSPDEKLPLKQKIAYAMGGVADRFATDGISVFFMAFFSDFLGVRATLVGLALALSRVWDAFTDPLAGWLSDRCRSRFGRRRPFILVGALLTGASFPLLYTASEDWSESTIFLFLCLTLLLYYTCYSLFSVPYEALGSELTPSYEERTRVFVVRTYVQEVFKLAVVWLFPFAIFLASMQWVGGEADGVRLVAILIGVLVAVTGILPAIWGRERYRDIALAENKVSLGIREGVRVLLANQPLLILIGVVCVYLFAVVSSIQLAYFVNVHYIYGGDIQQGTTLSAIDGTLRFSFSILGAWLVKRYVDHLDKHTLMQISAGILCVGFIGMYFTHVPGQPWLTLAMKPVLALGEAGFWILIFSMRADVCDWDEYQSGHRREGIISASLNWSVKLSISLAMLMGGILLEHYVVFQSGLEEGVSQLPGVMERMLLAYTVPPALAAFLVILLLRQYRLSRMKMREVRSALSERRGKI